VRLQRLSSLLPPSTVTNFGFPNAPSHRRNRRILRPLAKGSVVCLTAVSLLVSSRWGYRPDWRSLPLGVGVELPIRVGPTLATAWLLTALVARRRVGRGWIERLGRFLGWGWIRLWLVVCVSAKDSIIAKYFIA
jgi:hypothetical protein